MQDEPSNSQPDFFQDNHQFPERARKVLSDVSFVLNAHTNQQNVTEALTRSLGADIIHVTTQCVDDDITWALGGEAVVQNAELLKCQHGTVVADGTTCVKSVLGSFNPEKVVLATVDNAGLANQVKGLPVVVNDNGGGVRYLNPSPSQVAYIREHNQNRIASDCAGEKAYLRRRRENLRQRGKEQGIR